LVKELENITFFSLKYASFTVDSEFVSLFRPFFYQKNDFWAAKVKPLINRRLYVDDKY